jgi:DNA-binding PadR family transcriptional regulator
MERLARVGRATVDVLTVLLDAGLPQWGLEIIKATGRPSGTIYPLLDRLESAGWVTSAWDEHQDRKGPRRRLYVLTRDGATEARLVCQRAARRSAPRISTVRPDLAR